MQTITKLHTIEVWDIDGTVVRYAVTHCPNGTPTRHDDLIVVDIAEILEGLCTVCDNYLDVPLPVIDLEDDFGLDCGPIGTSMSVEVQA